MCCAAHVCCVTRFARWLNSQHVQITLCVGLVVLLSVTTVGTMYAQFVAPAIEHARQIQALTDRANAIDMKASEQEHHLDRIDRRLEVLDGITLRLAVLDDRSARLEKLEFLIVAQIIASVALLLMKAVQLKRGAES